MATLLAIIPVFLIILIGFTCRQLEFVAQDFWRGAEKLTYFLLFPALLLSKMSVADMGQLNFPLTAAVIVSMLLVVAGVLVLFQSLIKRLANVDSPGFTSLFQGGIRFNTYIGLALAASLYGQQGLVIAVIIAAIMIPVINILCVCVLEYFGRQHGSTSVVRLLKAVITNPLIVACVLGIGINLSGLALPYVVTEMLTIFSSAALPLGLLTVGAALSVKSIMAVGKPLIIASSCKFFLLPLCALLLAKVFGLESQTQEVLIVMCVLPTATASYVLAKQLGGDAELMASLITAQTLLAVILIPLMLEVLAAINTAF